MLEIIFLFWFCKKLASIARDKHRSSGWGALGAISWIGGEIGGAVLGIMNDADGGALYGYALLSAVVCAVLAYVFVRALRPLPPVDFPTARVV